MEGHGSRSTGLGWSDKVCLVEPSQVELCRTVIGETLCSFELLEADIFIVGVGVHYAVGEGCIRCVELRDNEGDAAVTASLVEGTVANPQEVWVHWG